MADSFVFYRSFDEACAELTDEQYGKIMRIINNYALNGTIPDNLSGIEKIVFTLIKPQIDANNQRKTNGCKGGAPSANNNAKKTTNGYTEKQPMGDFQYRHCDSKADAGPQENQKTHMCASDR